MAPTGLQPSREVKTIVEARLERIEEILRHAATPLLDRCALISLWVQLTAEREKVGQIVHPGGVQPRDRYISKAARELPIPGRTEDARRKFVERAIRIAGISQEGKAAAKEVGLHGHQSALLSIAAEPNPEAQLKKAKELADEKRAQGRKRKPDVVADSTPTDGTIAELQRELADKAQKLRIAEKELTALQVTSSPRTAPDEDEFPELPPDLDRRWSEEHEQALAELEAAWNRAPEFKAAWANAPLPVRERFNAKVLRTTAVSAVKPSGVHH